MEESKIKKIYEILNNIPVTEKNKDLIEEIRRELLNEDYVKAFRKIEELSNLKEDPEEFEMEKDEELEEDGIYPKQLSDINLERIYIGMLLNDPKQIVKFYFKFEECYFEDADALNAYKSVLFTEGGAYSSEEAKANFNFAKDNEESYIFKSKLKEEINPNDYDMEKIYINLKKLFVLRKSYLAIPIKNIQDKIVEITQYILYDRMSVEEIESAIQQVNDTEKFKRAVLNSDLTSFLELGDNNLRNGLELPFPIMTKVFKGIRRGETMAIAMPSNSGKSRLTMDIAAHVALVHKKKVLIISNEMSEEKMKLCLITTIINNKAIQEFDLPFVVSYEASKNDIQSFKTNQDIYFTAYSQIINMNLKHCIISNHYFSRKQKGCHLCKQHQYCLKDRKEMNFKIVTDQYCNNYVLHTHRFYFDKINDLNVDYILLNFLDETSQEIQIIVNDYLNITKHLLSKNKNNYDIFQGYFTK